jgi:DNA-binding MarR family transcriptional regulator
MLGYFLAHRSYTAESLHKMGLTPGHMKTLFELDADDPRSMGELAEVLACDASNATWLIDRLEERGLVERRPHPRDRRVKTVVLTAEGVATKKLLMEHMSVPPDDLVALDRADLETLRRAVRLLPERAGRPDAAARRETDQQAG